MELNKIKKALAQIRAEEIKEIKNKIKKIDLNTAEKNWNCTKWNGGTIYTQSTLTEKQKTKSNTEQKRILEKKELNILENKYKKDIEKIENLEKVDYLPKRLEIEIDWHNSRTWGACPSAKLWANYCGYYESRTIGGCGYDKRSTAAAEVLGQCKELKAAAFALLECQKMELIKKVLKKYTDTRALFGYGLHFGRSSVYFGSGCGMGSILQELEHLGYKVITRHEPNRGADYYQLEQDTKSKELKKILKKFEGAKNE